MDALLIILTLALLIGVPLFVPGEGPAAVLVCAAAAGAAALLIRRAGDQAPFLLRVFVGALVVRAFVAVVIYFFGLQGFFGGDAFTYDGVGSLLLRYWKGELNHLSYEEVLGPYMRRNWGMSYQVAVIYAVAGRNMLAVQMFNAVVGAATAPVIFLCARHIFENLRVARLAAVAVAVCPSLVLWSAQGLKDGPIVFLLAVAMLATLRLGEKLSAANVVMLVGAVFALLCYRFYIFYMVVAASGGALLIGSKQFSSRSLIRQFMAMVVVGLALTYFGVLRTASSELDTYGSLEAVQRSRADLSTSAGSGFGKDVDVSTARGALTAIPVGMAYLLFAPFPWQLASLRQSITLPEMLLWWASFPLLVMGAWFTIRHRLRRALPILIFTAMLTLAFSVFQGNVGTAYRQRSQLLVFYFIFVSVGVVLVKERSEDRHRARNAEAEAAAAYAAALSRLPRRRVLPKSFDRELKKPADAGPAVAQTGGGPPRA